TEHGVHHVGERERAADVERGTEPDLDVAHPVDRRILSQLVRDPAQRLGGLHHRERYVEASEIVVQVAYIAGSHYPAERLGRGCRERLPVLATELQQGRRADGTVEMAVQ